MPEESSVIPRRRPVDLLFGEELEVKPGLNGTPDAAAMPITPGYMVEPPRPATIVKPPPLEYPNEWQAVTPSDAAAVNAMPAGDGKGGAAVPAPAAATPPAAAATGTQVLAADAVIDTTPILTPESISTMTAPTMTVPAQKMTVPAPVAYGAVNMATAISPQDFAELTRFVDQLYQNVSDETSDSPKLNAECLEGLRAARGAIERGDYTDAEYHAEWVKSRLLRARASRAASHTTSVKLIWAWLGAWFVAALLVIMLPFAFMLVPEVVPLLRALALGALGAVLGAVWSMTHYFGRREYDPGYNSAYWTGPLKGALMGGVVWVLSALGILAAPGALGLTRVGDFGGAYLLMYLFALLAGFGQDQILRFGRGLLAQVFQPMSSRTVQGKAQK